MYGLGEACLSGETAGTALLLTLCQVVDCGTTRSATYCRVTARAPSNLSWLSPARKLSAILVVAPSDTLKLPSRSPEYGRGHVDPCIGNGGWANPDDDPPRYQVAGHERTRYRGCVICRATVLEYRYECQLRVRYMT
ncbi:hypothetical protein DAEQUDRAFT_510560 [Daedalea quercina L-15889]|uniref:Uncharacterized protein n=1 Tax=Daedalea quercina L-15889 TaxID=1314783 RepID=A0A165TB22_9APHY|nr:hypothetical protein DAEQUDRAFT_510560 [Daedalea quercina L-15889]